MKLTDRSMQRADPRARRMAFTILTAGTIAGTILIAAFSHFESQLYDWIEANADILLHHPEIGLVVGLVFTTPILLASGYLYVYGYRAAKLKRFPPPGYAVARDVTVITGSAASTRGRVIQLLAALTLFAGVSIPIVLWYLLEQLS